MVITTLHVNSTNSTEAFQKDLPIWFAKSQDLPQASVRQTLFTPINGSALIKVEFTVTIPSGKKLNLDLFTSYLFNETASTVTTMDSVVPSFHEQTAWLQTSHSNELLQVRAESKAEINALQLQLNSREAVLQPVTIVLITAISLALLIGIFALVTNYSRLRKYFPFLPLLGSARRANEAKKKIASGQVELQIVSFANNDDDDEKAFFGEAGDKPISMNKGRRNTVLLQSITKNHDEEKKRGEALLEEIKKQHTAEVKQIVSKYMAALKELGEKSEIERTQDRKKISDLLMQQENKGQSAIDIDQSKSVVSEYEDKLKEEIAKRTKIQSDYTLVSQQLSSMTIEMSQKQLEMLELRKTLESSERALQSNVEREATLTDTMEELSGIRQELEKSLQLEKEKLLAAQKEIAAAQSVAMKAESVAMKSSQSFESGKLVPRQSKSPEAIPSSTTSSIRNMWRDREKESQARLSADETASPRGKNRQGT